MTQEKPLNFPLNCLKEFKIEALTLECFPYYLRMFSPCLKFDFPGFHVSVQSLSPVELFATP